MPRAIGFGIRILAFALAALFQAVSIEQFRNHTSADRDSDSSPEESQWRHSGRRANLSMSIHPNGKAKSFTIMNSKTKKFVNSLFGHLKHLLEVEFDHFDPNEKN